jgi:isopenicillin N synthase-like dioxygenase
MTMQRPFRTATREEFPTLDAGPYLAGEQGALEELAAGIRHALENVGFMMLVNHGIDWRIVDDAFANAKRFHDLPLETKLALKVNEHQIGYVPMNATFNQAAEVDSTKSLKRDVSANLTFYQERAADDPKVLSVERFRGRNQWPGEATLPGFRAAMLAYHDAMAALGYRLLPVYAVALGMPAAFFDDYFRDPTLVVRMIKYDAVGELRADQHGASSHTDAGFITMLPQANVAGLQIKTRDGEWLDQPVVPHSLVVNSGNMLKRWSNDRFLATPHRVTTAVEADRYSLPFFFNPDLDDVIVPVSSCCGDGNPAKYKPIVYRDWFAWYLSKTYSHQRQAAE